MKIVVGLSGGVDSSVAAYLLKKQGHEVIGIFMRNWNDASVTLEEECPWVEDSNDALLVAEKLGIPFQVIDLSEAYKERIVDYMFYEYENGRTPNPDVLCNREIKFDLFLETALKLGADKVATGHYAQLIEKDKEFRLYAAKDKNKDQSYFLCQLNQNQLSKAIFPLGNLTKPEVREIAKEQDFITADKKDSQGLCFIGKVKLPDFLQQKLQRKTGDIIEINPKHIKLKRNLLQEESESLWAEQAKDFGFDKTDGKIIGQHQGAHFFTIGQRKGLGIGGHSDGLFVIEKDVINNLLFVGKGKDHPGLYKKSLLITENEIHWVNPSHHLEIGQNIQTEVRIRHRQPLVKARLEKVKNGLFVNFETPIISVSKGQFAAFYLEDQLIGSGIIH